jgi:hypothetical protein
MDKRGCFCVLRSFISATRDLYFTVGECAGRPVYRLPAAGEGIPGCAQAEELPRPQSWTGNICNLLIDAVAT